MSSAHELILFALDKEGKVAYADQAFASFCEQPRERIAGTDIHRYLHSYLVEYLKKEGKDFLRFARSNVGTPVRVDFVRPVSKQRRTYVCQFIIPEPLLSVGWEVIVVARDEEETKELRRLIEFERECSRQLLSGDFGMVITLDAQGRIVTVNKTCEENLRRRTSELVGTNVMSLLAGEADREEMRKVFRGTRLGNQPESFRLRLKADGTEIATSVTARALHDPLNDEVGFVLVLRDTEENLRMQATLGRIERMQALGLLSAEIAHQVNNYLHVLSGNMDLLELDLAESKSLGGDEINRLVTGTLKNARPVIQRLLDLMNRLKEFAKAQKGPSPGLADVNTAIRNVMALVDGRVRKKGVQVETVLEETIPPVRCSPLHLEQAILNIVLNGLDAVAKNEGEIRISSFAQDGEVHVAISDNGAGIAEEVRKRLFEPFVTTKPEGVGTGLGLAVARKAVADAGGKIDVETTAGSGTTMTLRLPMCIPQEGER